MRTSRRTRTKQRCREGQPKRGVGVGSRPSRKSQRRGLHSTSAAAKTRPRTHKAVSRRGRRGPTRRRHAPRCERSVPKACCDRDLRIDSEELPTEQSEGGERRGAATHAGHGKSQNGYRVGRWHQRQSHGRRAPESTEEGKRQGHGRRAPESPTQGRGESAGSRGKA